MSPYEMARKECADFINGACIWTADGGCLLARKPMKPCKRFEKYVLNLSEQPKAEKLPNYFGYVQARQSYLRSRKQEVSEVEFRQCPDCGNPLRKRQRYCGKCAKIHRRETRRKYMREKRKGA